MPERPPGRIIGASAPSNIALIKYMGKSDPDENLPENASISMTLNQLRSVAELSLREEPGDGSVSWAPELPQAGGPAEGFPADRMEVPLLGEGGIARVHRHIARVREAAPAIFGRFMLALHPSFREQTGTLRTANTFPPASGIASSASSFASITVAVAASCARDPSSFESAWTDPEFRRAWARVSRVGSGSSCRSFEGPWVLWEERDAAALQTRMPEMAHFVILVSSEPKRISSSEAHRRVRSSPLWYGRVERVAERAANLLRALGEGNLPEVARIAWAEFWEMHSLFHTCADPFSYWEPGTIEALQWLAPWVSHPNPSGTAPPIVTMDAGPNVHVIVDQAHRNSWRERLRSRFGGRIILEDGQGEGAFARFS